MRNTKRWIRIGSHPRFEVANLWISVIDLDKRFTSRPCTDDGRAGILSQVLATIDDTTCIIAIRWQGCTGRAVESQLLAHFIVMEMSL